MSFIATLPFEATGRIIIMYDDSGRAVSAHRDHDSVDLCPEFLWFRTNLEKPFYMLNPTTGEKRYVASHAAWFDTVYQYHGADATGALSSAYGSMVVLMKRSGARYRSIPGTSLPRRPCGKASMRGQFPRTAAERVNNAACRSGDVRILGRMLPFVLPRLLSSISALAQAAHRLCCGSWRHASLKIEQCSLGSRQDRVGAVSSATPFWFQRFAMT